MGIAEIIVAGLKNEEWLTRGVKNVTNLPRPVPYEFELQQADWLQYLADYIGVDVVAAASVFVKLSFLTIFVVVVLVVYVLAERTLNSPWGRMMRAIRDDPEASASLGKNVTSRHLQIFVIGSALIGIAGAMLTTLDGQFTPNSYQPLRFTFLIWLVWIEAEPVGQWIVAALIDLFPDNARLSDYLMDAAPHIRLAFMGLVLLPILRFRPQGLVPGRG